MPSFRLLVAAILCIALTGRAHADLFRFVEVIERPPESGFGIWHTAYQNRTNFKYLVHLQVANENCSVGGEGAIVQVRSKNNVTKVVETVPGFDGKSMSVIVPAGGRIRVQFYGDTNDGTVFDDCNSSFPKGTFQVSEPILAEPIF